MRPGPRKASSLKHGKRAALVAMLAALAVVLAPAGSAKPPPPPSGTYQVCLTAGTGTAACDPTVANYSVLTGAHPQVQVTIKNDSTSNQLLDDATLGVPAGIGLSIDTAGSAGAQNYSTYASASTSSSLVLQRLGLGAGASRTISFFLNSSSAGCTDGSWATQAESGTQPNSFVFTEPPSASSGLTSLVAKSCTLAFTYQPAAATANSVVTNQAYTAVADGAQNVTVTPVGLPVPLTGGAVSLTVTGPLDPGSAGQFVGTGPLPFSNGSVAFTALSSPATGGPFTLTAHAAAGFSDVISNPFVITQTGEKCTGQCATLNGNDAKGNVLFSIATSGGFSFVGGSPSGVPQVNGSFPAGCQSWQPLGNGVSGFVEFDGRTTGGTLQISYYVSQSAIKARYGKNTGQQFIPICFGVKYLDANQQPLDCATNPNPNGGWLGDALDPNTGAFTGGTAQAMCGPGGYYWGILSSYQDKLDQSVNPVVTGFNGPTNIGQNFRTFVITLPPGIDARGSG